METNKQILGKINTQRCSVTLMSLTWKLALDSAAAMQKGPKMKPMVANLVLPP